MDVPDPFPFKGEVIWLTPEQGGRPAGPPSDPSSYAQVAHVPPFTVETGTASFLLRRFDPSRLRSPAEGKWLVVENAGAQRVQPGTIVVLTEGQNTVAIFRVALVDE
jgi:SOS-response transcriptional repressor LexA